MSFVVVHVKVELLRTKREVIPCTIGLLVLSAAVPVSKVKFTNLLIILLVINYYSFQP